MIYIDENFGIMVDDYNYITGEVYKKSDGKILLRKTRYLPTLSSAIMDVANRTAKIRLQEKDMSLYDAVSCLTAFQTLYQSNQTDMTNINHC